MSIIKFQIDQKSLWYGIHNDYGKGQSATVHTPINQSKQKKKWRMNILELRNSIFELKNINKHLEEKCNPKTTSQAKTKLVNFFIFNKILYNGKKLRTNSSFAMYIKEELSKEIIDRKGNKVKNTHFHRLKLHYPISFIFREGKYKISNISVLNDILRQNGNYAFIVRGFECDTSKKSINFLISLVGEKGINLSQVFRRKKGVGDKLLLKEMNDAEQYVSEIISMYDKKEISGKENVDDVFKEINKTRVENGKLGEEFILNELSRIYKGATDIYHTSADFPKSPYDIEFTIKGKRKYVEVKSTSTDKKTFIMSKYEINFMNRYKEDYILFVVTNVKTHFPQYTEFNQSKILKLPYEYPHTKYFGDGRKSYINKYQSLDKIHA